MEIRSYYANHGIVIIILLLNDSKYEFEVKHSKMTNSRAENSKEMRMSDVRVRSTQVEALCWSF